MAIVMLGFMWGMYTDTRVNVAIVLGWLALMGSALRLPRSQFFVDDREYMKGMIPTLDRHPDQRTLRPRRHPRRRAR